MTAVFYVAFVFLVFAVREVGYALGALLVGVRIEALFLGLGPVIFRLRAGGRRLLLGLLPVGVLVGLSGATEDAQSGLSGEGERARGLFGKSYGGRVLVFLCGAAICLAGAWGFLFWGALLRPPPAPVVGGVTLDSPAREAGLEAADRIVSVSGQAPRYLFDVFKTIFDARGEPVEVELRRGGANGETLRVTLATRAGFGAGGEFRPDALGIEAPSLTRVLRVLPNSPAERAGVRGGDWIRSVGGKPVEVWAQVVEAVQATGGEETEIVVERDGARLTLALKPEVQLWRDLSGKLVLDADGQPQHRPLIGAVGDMGELFGATRSASFAAMSATQQAASFLLSGPARLGRAFLAGNAAGADLSAITVDLEQGLIETANPWYRIGSEVFLFFGVFFLFFSFYQALNGRPLVTSLLRETQDVRGAPQA